MKTRTAETAGHYVSDHLFQGRQTEQFKAASVLRRIMILSKTTHKELRDRHGMYHAEIELILRGGHISHEMALKLESAFAPTAPFWMKLNERRGLAPSRTKGYQIYKMKLAS